MSEIDDRLKREAQSRAIIDDCVGTMRSQSSRKFLYQHMVDLGTFIDTFNPDPYIHARRAGMRAAGITLQEKLKRCAPEEYKQMIKEQHQ
jgi:hypothetical protein